MIESRDQTTYSHSSHKCSARGSNQHWPELYHDATRQGTVKLGCSYAKWRWVHYLHGSSSSRELICLAQGQHGAASVTVIDPMTSRFGFPCFTTTSPRSLFVLCLFVCLFVCCLFVCLFVCLFELVFNVPVKSSWSCRDAASSCVGLLPKIRTS